jgi:primosomal protein N' (replication factor Y)
MSLLMIYLIIFVRIKYQLDSMLLFPFGNRKLVGVVVAINQKPSIDYKKIKAVIRVDNEVLFDEHLFKLFRFAANYYQYPIGQTIHTALPTRLKRDQNKAKKKAYTYSATPLLTPEYIKNIPPRKKKLKLMAETLMKKNLNDMEIKKLFNTPQIIIRELLEKSLIKASEMEPAINRRNSISIELNEDQQSAVNEILSKQSFHPFLIFGITGSGKTEVYMKLIDSYLKNKGQVLVMVPEINLTPQLEKRFEKRFPEIK